MEAGSWGLVVIAGVVVEIVRPSHSMVVVGVVIVLVVLRRNPREVSRFEQ